MVALSLRLVELKHGVEEEREEALMVDRGFVLHDESGQDQIQIAMNSVGPFYDSLILAAALEAKCRFLISEDLQDGQKIGQLKIVNPF